MLVLSRKKGEVICIGEGVTVEVSKVKGDKVWLAIKAPDSVAIDRKEVWVKKQKAKELASNGAV